jgi:hypothetical protein
LIAFALIRLRQCDESRPVAASAPLMTGGLLGAASGARSAFRHAAI